jgi:hypothetical protein
LWLVTIRFRDLARGVRSSRSTVAQPFGRLRTALTRPGRCADGDGSDEGEADGASPREDEADAASPREDEADAASPREDEADAASPREDEADGAGLGGAVCPGARAAGVAECRAGRLSRGLPCVRRRRSACRWASPQVRWRWWVRRNSSAAGEYLRDAVRSRMVASSALVNR